MISIKINYGVGGQKCIFKRGRSNELFWRSESVFFSTLCNSNGIIFEHLYPRPRHIHLATKSTIVNRVKTFEMPLKIALHCNRLLLNAFPCKHILYSQGQICYQGMPGGMHNNISENLTW